MLKFYSKHRMMPGRPLSLTSKLFTFLGLLFFTNAVVAQTTLISPTVNNGGFESGTAGWTFNQSATGTNDNRWEVGSVPTAYAGTNAAYISTGATGLPWAYSLSTTRVSYMYQDVTFPAGETNINLSFRWKGLGETTWDNLLVYIAPSTFTVSGLGTGTTSTTWTGATFLWRQGDISTSAWSSTNYSNISIPITGTQAGNASANSTMRLIFVWRGDNGGGTSPGACIDDITLVSSCTGAAVTTANSLSPTGATLNWTAFTGATGYNVRYKKVSDPTSVTTWATPTAVTGGTTTSLAISSLLANTQYEYQVSAVGSCTVYSSSSLFTTPCTSVGIPQTEGFNTTTIPSCWSSAVTTASLNSTAPAITYTGSTAVGCSAGGTLAPREGTNMIKFNSFDNQNGAARLVSKPMSTTGTASVDVAFLWYHDQSCYTTSNDGVQVQYSLDGTTWTNTGSFISRPASATGWSLKTLTLPSAAGNVSTLYVGFLFTSAYGNNCFMDSVVVVASPACGTPTALNAAATSATTASLSWTAPVAGIPTGYQYVVSTTNTTPSGAGTAVSGTSTTVTTGLSPNTTYYVFVRTACGGSVFSSWTASTSFTTPCASAPIPQTQGFNASTIPACWSTSVVTNTSTAPTLTYTTAASVGSTATGCPNPLPVREGTNMVKFNSFDCGTGAQIRLTSLPVSTTGSLGVDVSFLWYHDNCNYLTNNDNVQLQYSLNGTTWTNVGSPISRVNTTLGSGWSVKNFLLPAAAANVGTLYVGFLFTSGFGNHCFMDSVVINIVPPCTGTPAPGNTISSVATACSGTNFTLSLQNATAGAGVTYQWESSTNGTSYSDVSGATSATLTTSQTVATYYRCKVTCTGTTTGTSTAIQVNMNNYLNCYCTPTTTGWSSCSVDNITTVVLSTLSNTSACGTNGYTNYSSSVAAPLLPRGSTNTINVTVGPDNEYVSGWIDYNQNGAFETTEYFTVGNGNASTITNTITIPTTATLGNTMMRLRVRYNSYASSTEPCALSTTSTWWGETEDYLVRIVPQTPGATNSTQCGSATPALSVSSNTSASTPVFVWYTQASGGTAISGQSGATLSGYPISATTSFFVSEIISGVESIRKEVIGTYNPQPAASITASNNITCFGGNNGSATVTATGGSSYSYSWNSSPVQTTATATNLIAGSYTVTVTNSNSTCPATASVTLTQPTAAASIPAITVHPGNRTVCSTATTTFTGAATGLNITYQWQENNGSGFTNITNGGIYSGATTGTLTLTGVSTLMTTYTYRLVATGTCSPAAVSSSAILTVNATLPSVSASVSANNICAGASVTFTAAPVNGGSSPVYQWKVNGSPVGTNSSTYSSATLANNDMVTVDMSSSANCPVPATVTSTAIDMLVNPVVTPSVSIAASTPTTICAGTSVTFTATPVNGGTTPFYQWKVNGVNAGTNSSTFTTTTLAQGNIVSCQMTSSEQCPTVATVNSNNITMSVIAIVTPTVSITPSATTICTGTSVTFTSAITNGGSTPVRTWRRNGVAVGSGTSYTSTALANGDVITLDLASSLPCPSQAVVTSNSVTMTVNSYVTPFVVIGATQTTICAGASVTFTATPFNGGTTPAYQWKKNGVNVGTNSATYTTATLVQGDVITCVLTTSVMCYTSLTATSTPITMTVNPILIPSVSITASDDTICAGDLVTFTTGTVNPGTSPQYQWKKNGVNISGATSGSYSTTALTDGNTISVVLTSNAVCVSPATATSNTVTMKVNPLLTPNVTITADDPDSNVCANTLVTFTASHVNGGVTPGYQWIVNGVDMIGATSDMFSLQYINNGDVITLRMTSTATCPVPSVVNANSIKFKVEPTTPPYIFISANPGNKIDPGQTVKFSAVVLNGGTAAAYQWYKNDSAIGGATGTTYTTSELQNNDVVKLIVHSSLPCSDPDSGISNSMTMLYTTGVKELGQQLSDVKLYPNPNNGMFTLEAKLSGAQTDEHAKIEVLNGLGQLIFKENIEIYNGELKKQVTLTGIANGTYYIRLTSGDQSVIKPINVQQQ